MKEGLAEEGREARKKDKNFEEKFVLKTITAYLCNPIQNEISGRKEWLILKQKNQFLQIVIKKRCG